MIVSRCIVLLILTWGAFFCSAILNQGDMLYASMNTEAIILCFILSLALGSIASNSPKPSLRCGTKRPCFFLTPVGIRWLDALVLLYLFLVGVIILRFVLFKYWYGAILTRTQIFSPVDDLDGRLFSAVYVVCLYSKGVAAVFASFSFLRSLFLRDKARLIIAGLIMVADALIFSAKGPIIQIIFLVFLYFLLVPRLMRSNLRKALGPAVLLILTLWLIDKGRGNDLLSSFVHYVSVGPALLSSLIDGGYGAGYHNWDLDNIFLIFSGLDYMAALAGRVVGIPIQTAGYDWVKYSDIPMAISVEGYKFLPYNTFYTLLAEPYVSLRLPGVIGLGLALGISISKLEKRFLVFNCDRSLFWLQYFVGITFFGIFVSPFSSVVFWLVSGFMLFFGRVLFRENLAQKEKDI